MTQPLENNPTWKAGYAAGWAAFGKLMLEQMPESERVLAMKIAMNLPRALAEKEA